MAITEPIRDKKITKALADYYFKLGKLRNYCLIVLSLNTGLRISDILRLRWADIYDSDTDSIKQNICIVEKKTGKSKIITLNKTATRAVRKHLRRSINPTEFLIENARTGKAISRIQAYRIIRDAAQALGIGRVSCHSLRKTFGYHAWKSGAPAVVIMEIYNHSSFATTRRYLGITQDDQTAVYMKLAL
jgi:integrase